MSQFTSEYGQRLNAARTAAGITQQQLADMVGLSRSSVANIEGGRQAPLAEQVIQHADVLGIDPHWLLTGRGPDQAARLAAGTGLARRLTQRLPALTTDLRRIADNLETLAEGARP